MSDLLSRDWQDAICNSLDTHVITLNIMAAFACVWHVNLLEKLRAKGIQGHLLILMSIYLQKKSSKSSSISSGPGTSQWEPQFLVRTQHPWTHWSTAGMSLREGFSWGLVTRSATLGRTETYPQGAVKDARTALSSCKQVGVPRSRTSQHIRLQRVMVLEYVHYHCAFSAGQCPPSKWRWLPSGGKEHFQHH